MKINSVKVYIYLKKIWNQIQHMEASQETNKLLLVQSIIITSFVSVELEVLYPAFAKISSAKYPLSQIRENFFP